MTVKELIEQLERVPEDMEVVFAYDYGDYWNTTVCEEVEGVDVEETTFSEYHGRFKLINWDNDYTKEEAEKFVDKVILR